MLQLLEHLTGALGPWTYAIVGALVFMETVAFVGLLAAGEVTLLVGGAAAANGDVALVPMSRRRLVQLSALGVGLWAPTLVLASYVFADAIGSYLQYAGNVIIGLIAAAAAVYAVRRRRRPAIAR